MPLTAIILAAGAGTRLGELGRRFSKPMVPLLGRPLLDWLIADLHTAGVERIIVVGNPADVPLASHLQSAHPTVRFVTQPERLGIADALRCALPLVADEPAYVACACDSLFLPREIREMIARGRAQPGSAIVGVIEMGVAATHSRSAVRVDGTRVIAIIEKPAPDTALSGLVAAPLYWLPHAFAPLLTTAPPADGESYISTALAAFINGGGIAHAVRLSERIEVTTPSDLPHAEDWLRRRHP